MATSPRRDARPERGRAGSSSGAASARGAGGRGSAAQGRSGGPGAARSAAGRSSAGKGSPGERRGSTGRSADRTVPSRSPRREPTRAGAAPSARAELVSGGRAASPGVIGRRAVRPDRPRKPGGTRSERPGPAGQPTCGPPGPATGARAGLPHGAVGSSSVKTGALRRVEVLLGGRAGPWPGAGRAAIDRAGRSWNGLHQPRRGADTLGPPSAAARPEGARPSAGPAKIALPGPGSPSPPVRPPGRAGPGRGRPRRRPRIVLERGRPASPGPVGVGRSATAPPVGRGGRRGRRPERVGTARVGRPAGDRPGWSRPRGRPVAPPSRRWPGSPYWPGSRWSRLEAGPPRARGRVPSPGARQADRGWERPRFTRAGPHRRGT